MSEGKPWDYESAPPPAGEGAPSWLQMELTKLGLAMTRLEERLKPLSTLPDRVDALERAQSKSAGVGRGVLLAVGLLTAGGGATAGVAIEKTWGEEAAPRVIVVPREREERPTDPSAPFELERPWSDTWE